MSIAEKRRLREAESVLGSTAELPADSTGIKIPLAKIADHPRNRKDLGTPESLQELAVSLRSVERKLGTPFLQTPVVTTREAHLRAWPDHGEMIGDATHVMVFGHRRKAAAEIAGYDKIPVIINDRVADSDLETMIMENLHRKGINPIEEAVQFGDLRARGRTERQISEATGISQSQINKRLKLLKLPQAVQDAIAVGELPVIHGLAIADLGDPEQMRLVWSAIAVGTPPKEALAAHHRRTRAAESQAKATAEGLAIVDAQDLWGSEAPARFLTEGTDIEAARNAGTLAATIASDGSLTYVKTGPLVPAQRPDPAADAGTAPAEGTGAPSPRGQRNVNNKKAATKDDQLEARLRACERLVAEDSVTSDAIDLGARLLLSRENTPEVLALALDWLQVAKVDLRATPERVIFAVELARAEMYLRASWPEVDAAGAAHLEMLKAGGYEEPSAARVV